jgi:hypothetical protein
MAVMLRLSAASLCLGGCTLFFDATSSPTDAAPGLGDGGPGDSGGTGSACVPRSFEMASTTPSDYAAAEISFGMPPSRAYAVAMEGDVLQRHQPPLSGAANGSGIGFYEAPSVGIGTDVFALRRDTNFSDRFELNGQVYLPAGTDELPGAPGAGIAIENRLHLVVANTQGTPLFIEGTWTAAEHFIGTHEYRAPDLGLDPEDDLRYPQLSAGGLRLTFVVPDSGIHFIQRDRVDRRFEATDRRGVLLPGTKLRSPHLDDDCLTLWYANDKVVVRAIVSPDK